MTDAAIKARHGPLSASGTWRLRRAVDFKRVSSHLSRPFGKRVLLLLCQLECHRVALDARTRARELSFVLPLPLPLCSQVIMQDGLRRTRCWPQALEGRLKEGRHRLRRTVSSRVLARRLGEVGLAISWMKSWRSPWKAKVRSWCRL